MISEYRIAWTTVAAYIRRHIPPRRLRPNELADLHDLARDMFGRCIERGATPASAAEVAKDAVLCAIIFTP